MSHCARPFDESLLSGYVDGALIQLDEQRVRVHLETCPECRALVAELATLREAARSSRFRLPHDDSWREQPRGRLSSGLRWSGWLMVLTGTVLATVLLVRALVEQASLETQLLIGGSAAGLVLLLGSVGLDRLRDLRHDPYREVEK